MRFGVQNPEEISHQKLETCPPHLNNVAALLCAEQLTWCCLSVDCQYAQDINRLLSEPPTY